MPSRKRLVLREKSMALDIIPINGGGHDSFSSCPKVMGGFHGLDILIKRLSVIFDLCSKNTGGANSPSVKPGQQNELLNQLQGPKPRAK